MLARPAADRRAVGRHRLHAGGRLSRRPGSSGTASSATTCAASSAALERERSASAPAGSPASVRRRGRVPAARAVRFVACHDGLPLADVVAWAAKHNEANGEGNRDGWDGEVAWNGGVEGPTGDAAIRAAPRARGCATARRAPRCSPAARPSSPPATSAAARQRGNNNAWCQDNELGWIDWRDPADEFSSFFRQLLHLRERLRISSVAASASVERSASAERTASVEAPAAVEATALVEALESVSSFPSTESFRLSSFLLLKSNGSQSWLVAANAGEGARRFPVPRPPAGRAWRLRLDTARATGEEVLADGSAPVLAASTSEIAVAARSVRLFVAEG